MSFGLKPSEIEQIRLKYQEVLAGFYVPEETESMMDDYKRAAAKGICLLGRR